MDIKWIKENGKTAQGKNELIDYLQTGKKLSPGRAIKAQCYQCMNCYMDGKNDCQITDCPLFPFMPYRADKTRATRERTERQRANDKKLPFKRAEANKTLSASNGTKETRSLAYGVIE